MCIAIYFRNRACQPLLAPKSQSGRKTSLLANVDVAIIGVPSNMSSGRRDAAFGPDYMRALDTIATPDVQSLLKPLETLSVVDYGNFRD